MSTAGPASLRLNNVGVGCSAPRRITLIKCCRTRQAYSFRCCRYRWWVLRVILPPRAVLRGAALFFFDCCNVVMMLIAVVVGTQPVVLADRPRCVSYGTNA